MYTRTGTLVDLYGARSLVHVNTQRHICDVRANQQASGMSDVEMYEQRNLSIGCCRYGHATAELYF